MRDIWMQTYIFIRDHSAERVPPPKVVMFYSRLSVVSAIVNKVSFKKFVDPDRNPDPGTLDPDCNPDRH